MGEEMSRRLKGRRPSAAMIVACLALIVALGGTAVAGGVLNKKKVNKIISNRAPGLSVASAKSADNAANANNANNAANLGGQPPGAYQAFCKPGSIKATLIVDTAGFTSPTFVNEPGFNCFQPGNIATSVQLKKLGGNGAYQVRFVGNAGADNSGSAVCSPLANDAIVNCRSVPGGTDAPGEVVFDVTVTNSAGTPINDQSFSLLAF
jgi:hypothetical protein